VRIQDFDYDLPQAQIAQRPLETRDASRMLLLDRTGGGASDSRFLEFVDLLRGDELLVFNNAKVIPARLVGRRAGLHSQKPSRSTRLEHLSGSVEVFLSRQIGADLWEALVRPGRKLPVGERVIFGDGEFEAEIVGRGELGLRTVRFFSRDNVGVEKNIAKLGHVPLPPYIEREDESADRERYQTVFAKKPGAVAAPTAGLHFSEAMMERIRGRGIATCELTLDVGLGTFQPIHTERLEEHVMHAESYEIPAETAAKIQQAREAGQPLVAIGTTVVRALEDAAWRAQEAKSSQLVPAGFGDARIFITPGHKFLAVDALLTNFHLPRSTLLALVCAFAGRQSVLEAYRQAVQAGYRFYSYGDCMFIR
jgi:S-adenosylmethionine:tRNA ribosyltransferase-isomerase